MRRCVRLPKRLGGPFCLPMIRCSAPGAVATISEGLWERAFGKAPDAVGKVIIVNMTPVIVIGVNPRAFTGAKSVQSSPDIFMPL